jgi:hypothetical protein
MKRGLAGLGKARRGVARRGIRAEDGGEKSSPFSF